MCYSQDRSLPYAAQKRMAKKTKKWLFQNLLPVSLICAVAFGAAWPTPGVAVGTKVDGNSPLEIMCVTLHPFSVTLGAIQ